MRVALYQPDIPQNLGTILRLGACLAVPIDVIGPTGFPFSDRGLKPCGHGLRWPSGHDTTRFMGSLL